MIAHAPPDTHPGHADPTDFARLPDMAMLRLGVASAAHNTATAARDLTRITAHDGTETAVQRRLTTAARLAATAVRAHELAIVEARIRGQSWDQIATATGDDPNAFAEHGEALLIKWGLRLGEDATAVIGDDLIVVMECLTM